MKLHPWLAFFTASMLALVSPGRAASLRGVVESQGQPVRGALVSVFSSDGLTSQTVLTDAAGRYGLSTDLSGELTLRARAPLSADETAKLRFPAGQARLTHSFVLRRLTTPQEISDSLPASAHFAKIQFPTLIRRQQFQADCLSCHEIGNPFTRKQRPLEVWKAFTKIMTGYCSYTSDVHVVDYAEALHNAFDGKPIDAHENTTVDEGALRARIFEWKLPTAKLAHDTAYYPRDGKFYTSDELVDQITVTDTQANTSVVIPIPDLGISIGGNFADQNLTVPFGQSNRHGLHSLEAGPDGRFYATGAIGGEILVFDPATATFKSYPLAGRALYPHTVRIDSTGLVWFTIQISNQMGRFNPKTGHTDILALPTTMARPDERTPLPYGVDISPSDGSIWYTKLWANKVGRIDPKTLSVQEWVPPVIAPRRARFDATGGFWIPGYGDGKITRLDTKTMTYQTYQVPALAPDETEAPYALNIDPRTQDVWITANQSDRMFRLVPKTGKFTAFPLPTRGVYFRDIVFTPDGRVCASNNPMPALPEVVEGGMDSLICVEPEGNKGAT